MRRSAWFIESAPQEVRVLFDARDAKGGALRAGGDGQVVILDEETKPVLCELVTGQWEA